MINLILFNGKIATMDPSIPLVQAVAICENKIVKVGSNQEVLLLKDSSTQLIDLKEKLLLPGFNDSHMHLLSFGNLLQKLNLSGMRSISEMISKAKDFVAMKEISEPNWLLGAGWNDDFFIEGRFPNRYDLDKISTEIPICITRACYHVGVINSKALELLGVNSCPPQVEGGYFDIGSNGEPLGIFRENALRLIYEKIPEPSFVEIKRLLSEASKVASSEGITSIQTDDFGHIASGDYEKIITAYKSLIKEGKLTVRINEQCLLPTRDKVLEFLSKGYSSQQGDEYFKIGPLKLLADGSLGARTAYLCAPYKDDPKNKGIPIYNQEELADIILLAQKNNLQLAIHCIGDGAMYMALEAIEKAQKEYPSDNNRHSIVHCQITDKVLLNKFKELRIIAHIQPIFLDYDVKIVEDRVGKELASTSYNWKTMINKEIPIACGSDCPVEYFNVMKGIYCAVTRKDLMGNPKGGWLHEQKLTVLEAVYGFTMGGAYASFEEEIKGSITEGKLADMTVLSEDIFQIPPDNIKDVKILMTFLNGKLVYERSDEANTK